MTRLFNEPAAFADEMIDGFVASHGRWVKRVSGGVVRNTGAPRHTVALVIGGGSGHYPAFAGLVGQGLAHGAAMGNLFASPSAQQVYNVAKAANNGGGRAARLRQLRRRRAALRPGPGPPPRGGHRLPQHRRHRRHLLRAAGRARQAPRHRRRPHRLQGRRRRRRGRATPWTEVMEIAERANDRTRSFGVAFTGCTLPGRRPPAVLRPRGPDGRRARHPRRTRHRRNGHPDGGRTRRAARQPGSSTEIPDGVEAPAAPRVVPILNGLGSVKYEELFVVYRRVAQLLAGAGLEVVDPQVGEFVHQLRHGRHLPHPLLARRRTRVTLGRPRRHPGLPPRRGHRGAPWTPATTCRRARRRSSSPSRTPPTNPAPAAVRVLAALGAAKDVVDANVDELGRIDAIAGDGDHGIGMERGVRAAVDAARTPSPAAPGPPPPCISPATPGPTRPAAPPARCGAWPCGPSVTPLGDAKAPDAGSCRRRRRRRGRRDHGLRQGQARRQDPGGRPGPVPRRPQRRRRTPGSPSPRPGAPPPAVAAAGRRRHRRAAAPHGPRPPARREEPRHPRRRRRLHGPDRHGHPQHPHRNT